MQRLLPGGRLAPAPTAAETQRRLSRAALRIVATGSTLHRESMAVARTVAHAEVDAAEGVVGSDLRCAHETVDDRFDVVEAVSDRLEDRFLTSMLSTSQLTATYAEAVDDSVERSLRPERGDPLDPA
jgi:hypothetical protein